MTRIASVYAQALYDLAKDEGLSEEILAELRILSDAFAKEPDFVRLLATPSLAKEERLNILDSSFAGKVQPYVLSFMKILTEKGYMRHFADCCAAYKEQYNEDHHILTVKAVTAVPIRSEQADRLAAKLKAITGKEIELSNVVDPSCLGGVRLDYDGKRVDDTLQHRLAAVHSMLKNTIL